MQRSTVLLLVLALGLFGPSGAASAANVAKTLELGECGEVLATTPYLDYRYRNATVYSQRSYEDNWRAHTNPAIQALSAGEVSQAVIADLNFTLNNWPNHLPALRALIDYDKRGGKQHNFRTVECYFRRARGIVPDDVGVVALHAMYYQGKKDFDRATSLLNEALAMDSTSIDIHYMLGLLYADTRDYDKALGHAHVAYAAGYPLPGLRNKLISAGVWTEPPKPNASPKN